MKFTTRLALVVLGLTFSLCGKSISLAPRIPAGFEPAASGMEYAAKGLRYEAATSPGGFRLRLNGADGAARVVSMSIVNGNTLAAAHPLEQLPVKTRYMVGKRADWRTTNTYRRLRYEGVLPGIDMEYRPAGDQLEFDFILRAGADATHIALRYQGQDGLSLDSEGNLIVAAGGETFVQEIPAIYQRTERSLQLVSGRYELASNGDVRFVLGPYDTAKPLVIDPVISYSGFVTGAGSTVATCFARDGRGRWYVAGNSGAGNLPVAGNAPQNARNGDVDGFVMRVDPNIPGGPLVTDLTYFGGVGADEIRGMAVDAAGVIYITGTTQSTNLPVTDASHQNTSAGDKEAFYAKLDLDQPAASSLRYVTYYGGAGMDVATAVAVDAAGNVYLTGYTSSTNLETKGTPYQATAPNGWNGFLAQYDSSGKLTYSSYVGGGGTDIPRAMALAADGGVILAGTTYSWDFPMAGSPVNSTYSGGGGDVFVAKISLASGLIYSTFLGGTGGEDLKAMTLNAAGQIVLTGWTLSQDFPVTANALQKTLRGGTDGFVCVLDPTLPGASALVYATLFGGSHSDIPYAVATDAAGQILLTGYTYSASDFPVTANAFQPAQGGAVDAFVTRLDPSKQGADGLLYSTYLGGAGNDYGYAINVDANGTVYTAGSTTSAQFPNAATADRRTKTAGANDAFLLALQP